MLTTAGKAALTIAENPVPGEADSVSLGARVARLAPLAIREGTTGPDPNRDSPVRVVR